MSGVGEIAVQDLHLSYGRNEVLRGFDLHVESGSFTAVLGPSGCGKTTFLRCLAGFERSSRGSISIGGVAVEGNGAHVHSNHRRIGYVPQEGSLFPHLTVAKNVVFGVKERGRRRTALGLLEMVGLAGMEDRYPHQLSGGQQQRVALARALATEPRVVLLDEPFAALDDALRAQLREDVRGILRETNTTAILVTHDQDEALSMADSVAVMRDGRVAQLASPEVVYTEPIDPALAKLVGDSNLLEGRWHEGRVTTPLGTLDARTSSTPAGEDVTVLVRPEQLEIHGEPTDGDVVGRVTTVWFHGHDAVAHVECGAVSASLLVVRITGDREIHTGDLVALRVRGAVWTWPRLAATDVPSTPAAAEGGAA